MPSWPHAAGATPYPPKTAHRPTAARKPPARWRPLHAGEADQTPACRTAQLCTAPLQAATPTSTADSASLPSAMPSALRGPTGRCCAAAIATQSRQLRTSSPARFQAEATSLTCNMGMAWPVGELLHSAGFSATPGDQGHSTESPSARYGADLAGSCLLPRLLRHSYGAPPRSTRSSAIQPSARRGRDLASSNWIQRSREIRQPSSLLIGKIVGWNQASLPLKRPRHVRGVFRPRHGRLGFKALCTPPIFPLMIACQSGAASPADQHHPPGRWQIRTVPPRNQFLLGTWSQLSAFGLQHTRCSAQLLRRAPPLLHSHRLKQRLLPAIPQKANQPIASNPP